MKTLATLLQPSLLAQVSDPNAPARESTRVEVRCACGKVTSTSARSLARKWAGKPAHLCKSCSVRKHDTAERKRKFAATFAAYATSSAGLENSSRGGRRVWSNRVTAARISEAVRVDNTVNPAKVAARTKALAAFMSRADYRAHLLRIRSEQQRGGTSVLEEVVARCLGEIGIKYTRQFNLGYYNYDFLVESVSPYLLEVRGEYWHRDTQDADSAKATYAAGAGYRVKHLWESNFGAPGMVRDRLKLWSGVDAIQSVDFNFEDVELCEVEPLAARVFLGAHHYLSALSRHGRTVGCRLGDELIATATFSSPTRDETARRLSLPVQRVKELVRFCIHESRHKKNFASWFLSRAVGWAGGVWPNTAVMVAFADTTMGHTGTIYRAANWRLDGVTDASYVYINGDGYYCHKKTIWDRAVKLGVAESVYAAVNGYRKIDTLPKLRFLLEV